MRVSIHGLFFRKYGKNLEPDSSLDAPLYYKKVEEALKYAGIDNARIEIVASELKDSKGNYKHLAEIIPSTKDTREQIEKLIECLLSDSLDVEVRSQMAFFSKER